MNMYSLAPTTRPCNAFLESVRTWMKRVPIGIWLANQFVFFCVTEGI